MRHVHYSSKFKKDLKRAGQRSNDISILKAVIGQLAVGQILEPKYKDHSLIGNYAGARECHLSPDWLLIYRYESTNQQTNLIADRHTF